MPLSRLPSKMATSVEVHHGKEPEPMLKRISKLLRIPTICSYTTHGKIKSRVFANEPTNNIQPACSTNMPAFSDPSIFLKKYSQSEHSFVEILSPPHRRNQTGTTNTKTDQHHYSNAELSTSYSDFAYTFPSLVEGRSVMTETSGDNVIYSENLKEYLYPRFIRTVNLPITTPALKKSKPVKIMDAVPATQIKGRTYPNKDIPTWS